jgi:hypothetical protein
MNKLFLRTTGFALLLMVNIFSSCQKEDITPIPLIENAVVETPESDKDLNSRAAGAIPDLNKLADELAYFLGGTTGYSFVISYKNQASVIRAGGKARTHSNAPERAMETSVRYSIASVSKTISAAAMMNVLNTFPNSYNMIDWPIWPYLPTHWVLGPNVKTITFRDLLQHKSGFRNTSYDGNNCTYEDLKALVAKGIIPFNKFIPSYNNRNYALMRILIPALAKYKITPWNPANFYPGAPNSLIDPTQAVEYANAYKDYCRKSIFNKLITCAGQVIDCKNTEVNPGLYYDFNGGYWSSGVMEGNLTMSSAGQGWVLTTNQMSDFFKTLHYTDKIIPKMLSDIMKNELMGYDVKNVTNDGISYYYKNGKHAYKDNYKECVYRSLIIGFGDDIQMSIMTNSNSDIEQFARLAHEYWHP